MDKAFSLYIHIPFCGQRCPYCDFNTYVESRIPEKNYTEAIIAELRYRASLDSWQERNLKTIFFGGGTPSLFSAESLGKVIAIASELFPSTPAKEISLEANPGTVSEQYFTSLLEVGFNRVSIGAQTLNESFLRTLGRAHTVEETRSAYAQARKAGFHNINLDLMYALPEQSLRHFGTDLNDFISLNPTHISAYQLTIEKGTPFYLHQNQGKLALPPEERTLQMMNQLVQTLAAGGYEQYEISNFAQDGARCLHNQTYWQGGDYLGIGAGAHSFSNVEGDGFGRRWSNFALPAEYINRSNAGLGAESWADSLSENGLLFEFFFLGLRQNVGVSRQNFFARFGYPIEQRFAIELSELKEGDLIEEDGSSIRLTEKGRALSDSVFEYFIVA